MKVSRLLTVALAPLFAVSCGGDPNRTDRSPGEQPTASTGTTGETERQSPPPELNAQQSDEKRAPLTAAPKATPVSDAAKAAGVNPDAAVLADFKQRVDAYMKVRKDAIKEAPSLKETDDPAKIKTARDAMAAQIRAARPTAKQGDVFTPEITAKFRRLLSPELKGDDGRDAKAILKDDAPSTESIPFKVNAKYPEGEAVPTVPASLLLNLPTLPDPLHYRIIGRHLILLDEDADVIVDYALNVIR